MFKVTFVEFKYIFQWVMLKCTLVVRKPDPLLSSLIMEARLTKTSEPMAYPWTQCLSELLPCSPLQQSSLPLRPARKDKATRFTPDCELAPKRHKCRRGNSPWKGVKNITTCGFVKQAPKMWDIWQKHCFKCQLHQKEVCAYYLLYNLGCGKIRKQSHSTSQAELTIHCTPNLQSQLHPRFQNDSLSRH